MKTFCLDSGLVFHNIIAFRPFFCEWEVTFGNLYHFLLMNLSSIFWLHVHLRILVSNVHGGELWYSQYKPKFQAIVTSLQGKTLLGITVYFPLWCSACWEIRYASPTCCATVLEVFGITWPKENLISCENRTLDLRMCSQTSQQLSHNVFTMRCFNSSCTTWTTDYVSS